MTLVLHFRRELGAPPVAGELPGIALRNIRLPEDVAAWLALRERTMAGQEPVVRTWTAKDFEAEMSGKAWWREDRTWLANDEEGDRGVVGAVTLAVREGVSEAVPVVHWLLVAPEYRRRGVARLLMSHLERVAWDVGWREVQLETHAGWREAVAFYQSMGYAPVRERSPR